MTALITTGKSYVSKNKKLSLYKEICFFGETKNIESLSKHPQEFLEINEPFFVIDVKKECKLNGLPVFVFQIIHRTTGLQAWVLEKPSSNCFYIT